MGWGSVTGRRHVDLAWIGIRIGDKLGNRFGRDRWIHHHDEGLAVDARDRRDVADEIVVELVVQCRVDRVEATDHEQRVAVSGRAHDDLSADIGCGARPVLDNKRLADTEFHAASSHSVGYGIIYGCMRSEPGSIHKETREG